MTEKLTKEQEAALEALADAIRAVEATGLFVLATDGYEGIADLGPIATQVWDDEDNPGVLLSREEISPAHILRGIYFAEDREED